MGNMNTLIDEAGDMTTPLNQEFCLGEWLVQPQLNRIQHPLSGQQKQLEPRLVLLLCHLAGKQGEMVSRDELVQQLWPKVIVNENSLTRAVSELRKQLNTSGSEIVYIETIPKKGYRLIPLVEFVSQSPARNEEHSAQQTEIPRALLLNPASWRVNLWQQQSSLPAFGLMLILGALLSWNSTLVSQGSQPATLLMADEVMPSSSQFYGGKVTLRTTDGPSLSSISQAAPALSNDGERYAYIESSPTGSTVYLGKLGGILEPEAIFRSSNRLCSLAWSPLGNGLLFAMQPALAKTALYNKGLPFAELVLLNLETLKLTRLISGQEIEPTESNRGTELNLT